MNTLFIRKNLTLADWEASSLMKTGQTQRPCGTSDALLKGMQNNQTLDLQTPWRSHLRFDSRKIHKTFNSFCILNVSFLTQWWSEQPGYWNKGRMFSNLYSTHEARQAEALLYLYVTNLIKTYYTYKLKINNTHIWNAKSSVLRESNLKTQISISLPSISSFGTIWQISHFDSNYVRHAGVKFHFIIKNSEMWEMQIPRQTETGRVALTGKSIFIAHVLG